jgi:TatD DNase family protein
MFVDTHCHLNMMVDKKRDEEMTLQQLESVACIVEKAEQQGVSRLINVGTTINETRNSILLAQRYKNVFATVGIHPCDATSSWRKDLSEIRKMLDAHRDIVVGVGETGLDFYHKPYDANTQTSLFEAHIELALEYDLPLVVHVRDAGDEALKVLERYKAETRGVVHCFSLGLDAAQEVASWGNWHIGIDGPVTYPKNDWLREVVAVMPLDFLLLETDAPFLPPQQFRGKQNSPVHLPLIADAIAQARGCTRDDVAAITSKSAEKVFRLPATR